MKNGSQAQASGPHLAIVLGKLIEIVAQQLLSSSPSIGLQSSQMRISIVEIPGKKTYETANHADLWFPNTTPEARTVLQTMVRMLSWPLGRSSFHTGFGCSASILPSTWGSTWDKEPFCNKQKLLDSHVFTIANLVFHAFPFKKLTVSSATFWDFGRDNDQMLFVVEVVLNKSRQSDREADQWWPLNFKDFKSASEFEIASFSVGKMSGRVSFAEASLAACVLQVAIIDRSWHEKLRFA